MRNQNVFIQIFILLLIKVFHIRSACTWGTDPQKTCSLTCGSGSLEDISTTRNNLVKKWTEAQTKYPACVVDGIYLQLENIKYENNIVKPGFLPDNIKVRELTIKLNRFLQNWKSKSAEIEINAFHADGLKSLKKLEISNVLYDPIKKGTFNGLDNLEVLRISGILSTFESGLLDGLNATLKEFSLQEEEKILSVTDDPIWIYGLTGSVAMEKLETVRIKYNLKKSIDSATTFVGLTNVKTLDLSDCQIESISVGSFDIMDFLEVLKLENNKIAIIPDGLLNRILIRNATQVFLGGNAFLCDCNLKPFKLSLKEYSNFVGDLKCDKPEKYKGQTISTTSFYDDSCEVPTTTSSTTSAVSTSSTPPSSTTCTSPGGSEIISIDAPARMIQINKIGSDDIILQADDELDENAVLIWFSSLTDQATNATTNGNMNCQMASGPNLRIDNLVEDLAYTICLMDRLETTVSPLDCISYKRRSESVQPWLSHESKGRIIGIALITCAVGALIGLAIGSLSYKLRMWTRDRKECMVRSCKSSRASSMRRSRMSAMTSDSFLTRRTSNATVQYYINGSYDAPPLPARPISMYLMDEPVYATIRFSNKKAASQAPDNFQTLKELSVDQM